MRCMIEIVETGVFSDWLGRLDDPAGRLRILARINRVRHGNLGERRENIAPGERGVKHEQGWNPPLRCGPLPEG